MATTYHTSWIDGTPLGVPNEVNDTTVGYYVSYNNYDRHIYGCDTTAIVVNRTSAFLILNGDHRAALRGLSLADACNYFHTNCGQKNHWSDDHQDDVLVKVEGTWKMVRHKSA